MFLAYFGPETMMPMTSIFAVVAGVFMMLGRQAFALIRLALRKVGRMVGLVKTPVSSPAITPTSARLDPAESPIHGGHTAEVAHPKTSDLDASN